MKPYAGVERRKGQRRNATGWGISERERMAGVGRHEDERQGRDRRLHEALETVVIGLSGAEMMELAEAMQAISDRREAKRQQEAAETAEYWHERNLRNVRGGRRIGGSMRFRVTVYEPRTVVYEVEAKDKDAAWDEYDRAVAAGASPVEIVEVHDQAIMDVSPVDSEA